MVTDADLRKWQALMEAAEALYKEGLICAACFTKVNYLREQVVAAWHEQVQTAVADAFDLNG